MNRAAMSKYGFTLGDRVRMRKDAPRLRTSETGIIVGWGNENKHRRPCARVLIDGNKWAETYSVNYLEKLAPEAGPAPEAIEAPRIWATID